MMEDTVVEHMRAWDDRTSLQERQVDRLSQALTAAQREAKAVRDGSQERAEDLRSHVSSNQQLAVARLVRTMKGLDTARQHRGFLSWRESNATTKSLKVHQQNPCGQACLLSALLREAGW